jgi:hypothetical protein
MTTPRVAAPPGRRVVAARQRRPAETLAEIGLVHVAGRPGAGRGGPTAPQHSRWHERVSFAAATRTGRTGSTSTTRSSSSRSRASASRAYRTSASGGGTTRRRSTWRSAGSGAARTSGPRRSRSATTAGRGSTASASTSSAATRSPARRSTTRRPSRRRNGGPRGGPHLPADPPTPTDRRGSAHRHCGARSAGAVDRQDRRLTP